MALNINESLKSAAEIMSTLDRLITAAEKEGSNLVKDFKERFNIVDALAFNIAATILSDGSVDDDQEEFLNTFLTQNGSDKDASYYFGLFLRKKSDEYKELESKYGHEFDSLDSMWMQLLVISTKQTQVNYCGEFVTDYTFKLLIPIIESDGNVEDDEIGYCKKLTQSLANVADAITNKNSNSGSDSSASNSAMPLKVTGVGGTLGPKDRDGEFNIMLGVDIHNPNPDKLASMVTVEITLKSKSGSITEVITDTIYCIDAGATFHYGCEKYWMKGQVSNISAAAYAQEFLDIGNKKLMDGAVFSNFSITHGRDCCDITGELKSNYNKTINGCYLYYQLKKDGKILGGNNTYVDILPIGATRSLKIENSVDVKAGQLVYSIDFDLRSI